MAEIDETRVIYALTGADVLTFLQGIVSNDVLRLAQAPGLVWAALLSPQGKYLADFLIARVDGVEGFLLDIHKDLAPTTLRRLAMYKLRADVKITPTEIRVTRGLETPPPGALPDPRHPALGWRAYGQVATADAPTIDWDTIRVEHVIPESLIELIPDDTYLLEAGFERLHGVDFRKGCYVGQEVTARMKHKTELKKGLVRVSITGDAVPGTEITADGKPAGTLFTRSGDHAIAYLRFDRATGEMQAGEAVLRRD